MKFNNSGFARLDFDEAKRIAQLVGFDIMTHAAKKKSCGPGCKYLANDKRYFVLLLLKHIDAMSRSGRDLPSEVETWYDKAQTAAGEYRDMEKRLYKQ